ncbi:tubulin beta chain [Flagelloscypha sp. PMI_526]|nr:tubulin beta chain [Flagelloscypha sp. PMI_526]
MGEIINLQIGGCGNSVGSTFWETIASEHGLEVSGTYMGQHDIQLERIGVFYRELRSRRYIPRAVLVDLEPSALDLVHSSRIGRTFPPGNYVFGNHLGGNWGSDNWARGFLENGPTIDPDILNVVRREAERTDTLQGFHLIHGSGGSAGGGLGCHLLLRLAEEYPNRTVSTSTVFHELWTASPEPFEPYGAVLSMQQLTEGSNTTVCMGNGSLDTIANRLANVYSKPPYYTVDQFNLHLAQALAGVTTSLRFPSLVNSDLTQMERNMIPFPRLHFLTPSLVFDLHPRETNQLSFLDTFLRKTSRTILANFNRRRWNIMQRVDSRGIGLKRKWHGFTYKFMEAESSVENLVTQYQEHQKLLELARITRPTIFPF